MRHIEHCTCTTCRDYDFQRGVWKYIPVRYTLKRQSLRAVLAMLDNKGRQG